MLNSAGIREGLIVEYFTISGERVDSTGIGIWIDVWLGDSALLEGTKTVDVSTMGEYTVSTTLEALGCGNWVVPGKNCVATVGENAYSWEIDCID